MRARRGQTGDAGESAVRLTLHATTSWIGVERGDGSTRSLLMHGSSQRGGRTGRLTSAPVYATLNAVQDMRDRALIASRQERAKVSAYAFIGDRG